MRGLLTATYNILPDFAALVLAAFGVAALFLTDLFDKLKPWNKTRWALAIVIGLFGFGALLSNNDQKLQEKTRSDAERGELTGQINQLLATAQIQVHIIVLGVHAGRLTSARSYRHRLCN
jgi:hypothetical protein